MLTVKRRSSPLSAVSTVFSSTAVTAGKHGTSNITPTLYVVFVKISEILGLLVFENNAAKFFIIGQKYYKEFAAAALFSYDDKEIETETVLIDFA